MSYETAKQSVAQWGRSCLQFIVPCPCLACGVEMEDPAAAGLCEACRGLLRRPPGTPCVGCGRSLMGNVPEPARCGLCRKKPPPWDALTYAWVYQPPLDAVIMGLKFRRLDYLGTRLGHQLADLLRGGEKPDCVTPVPLHWTRRLSRGFDQADLIAAALAESLGLPLVRALRRTRRTPAQSQRDRRRRGLNLEGAFACRRRLEGRTVMLVDDVLTTGATLRAAAHALRRGGASRILVVALARTPSPDELS